MALEKKNLRIQKMKNFFSFIFLIVFLVIPVYAEENIIVLATTTFVENSGLLSYILPAFEKKTGIKVKVIARGKVHQLRLVKDEMRI